MKLSTRLIFLVLGCLLPLLAAQVYSQMHLNAERHQQLGELVLRQAELANAEVTSIVDAVHQLGAVAASQQSSDGCSRQMSAMRQSLAQYRFLALFSSV